MKSKNDLVNNWINKAEKDLLTANHEFAHEQGVAESVCFHCQQATEKYIKAYLTFLDIEFPYIHEIGKLITLCELKDNEISHIKEEADNLTAYAVEVRYAEDFSEPTDEDVSGALKITESVRKYVLSKIKLPSSKNHTQKK